MQETSLYPIWKDELLKGEEILWSGQPDPSILFSKSDIFNVPFAIFWAGFSVFWMIGATADSRKATTHGGPFWFFPLFGIPFVMIGLYMLFGRYFYKVRRKKRTFYAVTNKRVLVMVQGRSKNLQGLYLNAIPVVNKSLRRDGRGTLTFGDSPQGAWMYEDSGFDFLSSYYGNRAPAFKDIQDAEKVSRLVTELRSEQSNG